MLVVTRNVASTTSASTVHVKCLVHLLQNLRVSAHTEVVVGAPNSDLVLGGVLVSARELLGQTVDVVEVAVRLVFVLLIQFALVVRLVIEMGCLCTLSLANI